MNLKNNYFQQKGEKTGAQHIKQEINNFFSQNGELMNVDEMLMKFAKFDEKYMKLQNAYFDFKGG